jgi:hypothetical protein
MLTYSVGSGRIGVRNNPERTSGNSGRCLSVTPGGSANGTALVVKTCSSTDSRQVFRMTTDSQLKVPSLGKCVRENSSHRLVLASCSTEAAQRWIVDPDPR